MNTETKEIVKVNPYKMDFNPARLNWASSPTANQMLVRQVAFPEEYVNGEDIYYGEYSDHCWRADPERWDQAPFLGQKQMGIEDWIRSAHRTKVIKYLQHQISCRLKGAFRNNFMKTKFTGFRVTVTLRPDNGYPVYYFELFNRKSDTAVSSKK